MNINDAIWVGFAIGLVITSIGGAAIRWYFYRDYVQRRETTFTPIPGGALRHTVTLPSRCRHCGRDL